MMYQYTPQYGHSRVHPCPYTGNNALLLFWRGGGEGKQAVLTSDTRAAFASGVVAGERNGATETTGNSTTVLLNRTCEQALRA